MSRFRLIQAIPSISVRSSAVLAIALMVSALLAFLSTPHLTEVLDAPSLEDTVPRQFGDWKELPSAFLQVSLSTDIDPNMDQPYDQTVMRTYVNTHGQQVMLALAWGKRQRQEVKIHRPDLCYISQGFEIKNLDTVKFLNIKGPAGNAIIGKHMYAANARTGEAVSYWMRIGSLYSEDAFATRLHIMKEGFSGRIPDGILVRASMHYSQANLAQNTWPLLDSFLFELVKSVPAETRVLLLGTSDSAPRTHDK